MIRASIEEKGSPKQVKETFPTDLREQLATIPDYWHDKYLLGHFQTTAVSKYGYQQRTKKHNDKKQRLYGHRRPLEMSGASKQSARQGIKLTVRRKSSQGLVEARGTMKVPKYFYYQPGGIDLQAELVATTKQEEEQMGKIYEERAQAAVANRQHKKRRRRVR